MNNKLSGVIIAKNEAVNIGKTISALKSISDDIIVLDSGSTDNTREIAENLGAIVHNVEWLGYGKTKNLGHQLTQNDWIISVDADELLSEELIANILKITFKDRHIYHISTKQNYCGKWITYSEFKPKHHPRIFNKQEVKWNDRLVHESLEPLHDKTHVFLDGHIMHYSYADKAEHLQKLENYAKLTAEQWAREGYNLGFLKRYLGPSFRFLKSYILNLGFLEGKLGYQISVLNAKMLKIRNRHYDKIVSK